MVISLVPPWLWAKREWLPAARPMRTAAIRALRRARDTKDLQK
jgi:hypothetical protein